MTVEQTAYDPAIFEELALLEPRSFWFRGRSVLLAWALDRYFPAARSFLEIGCGTGYTLAEIRRRHPGLEVTGAELFPEGLDVARRRLPDVRLLALDARALPFEGEFDVVGAFDVLEHIPDDGAALASMRRAVAPRGGVIVTVPQHPRLWSAADTYAHHQRRYTRRELVEKLQSAAFEVVRVTSFVSFLLPLMILSRFRHRSVESFDFRQEFELPFPIDQTFAAVLAAERRLIRLGVSFPAGGSLLAVATARPA